MATSYGVRQATVLDSETERHAEEICIIGFTIVRGVLQPAAAAALGQTLGRIYEAQVQESGGIERLRRINDADVVRCPLSADRMFLDAAASPKLLELARHLLGEYYILQQQNGVLNRPSDTHYQRAWHRDLPYQHFTSSRPLAISALIFLDPFTAETGSTMVLPGSHKSEPFPSEAYVSAHETSLVGAPGDAAVFDSMLFHRAGRNTSTNLRRGLNQVYALPFLSQQILIPRALGYSVTDPPMRKFLGYEVEPAGSASEWRKRRLDKLS